MASSISPDSSISISSKVLPSWMAKPICGYFWWKAGMRQPSREAPEEDTVPMCKVPVKPDAIASISLRVSSLNSRMPCARL